MFNVHTKYLKEDQWLHKSHVVSFQNEGLQKIAQTLNENARVKVEGKMRTKFLRTDEGDKFRQMTVFATNLIVAESIR